MSNFSKSVKISIQFRFQYCEYKHIFFSNSKIVKIKQSYITVHAMTILLQVVIGGINVDFIAKGKTKALKVSFIYDMESATIVQRR